MSRKPRGSIHKIREFELEKINLIDEFDILQIVGEGWFGKILLVEHRASQTEMVLKAVPKPYVSLRDFYREFHYGLHLGIHRHVVTTYDVAFETAGFYVFTQEYAPLGDLTSNVTETGVGEVYSKRVAKQIASALDYMHSKDIVHRDVKLDNVLIYRSDFSRVKLCDFGESFQAGTIVERRNEWLPYSPPEVLEIKPEGTYKADPSHDVWQFGIVIFVCLTGCLPWQKAASDDPRYVRYLTWQGAMILPIRRTPKLFKLLSSRAQRMFRRFLEPRSDKRPRNLCDVAKFLDDRWLAKTAEKEMAEYETDELCPSMYSFHSSPDEKNRLLYTLADCGIETNVDRQTKKNRIRDWIESSVINEEDEDENEESASASPSSSISREPVAGHISSIRQTVDKSQEIRSKLKDAAQKHFDPRTGALQCGPSEMGVVVPTTLSSREKSLSSTISNGDSVCGSLQTLGSGQNLEASNLQLYTTVDNNQPHAMDNAANERFYNQSFSSSDLVTALKTSAAIDNNQGRRITLADAANSFASGKSPSHPSENAWTMRNSNEAFQRTKTTMYASSPAIDNSHSHFIGQPNLVKNARPNMDPTRPAAILNDRSTVTGTGGGSPVLGSLANFTETAAQFVEPPVQMSVQENQRLYQSYYKWQNNDFHIKDSAYGSTDISESAVKQPMERSNGHQSNGNVGHVQQYRQPTTTVRTQNSQRQRLQDDVHGEVVTTKDTAYDRVVVSNSNRRKR